MGLNALAENSRLSSVNLDGSLTGRVSALSKSLLAIFFLPALADMHITWTGGVSDISEPFVLTVTIPPALGKNKIPELVQNVKLFRKRDAGTPSSLEYMSSSLLS